MIKYFQYIKNAFNIFNILNERKAEIEKKGVKVYDLFVGTPDFSPAPHVMEAVVEARQIIIETEEGRVLHGADRPLDGLRPLQHGVLPV